MSSLAGTGLPTGRARPVAELHELVGELLDVQLLG